MPPEVDSSAGGRIGKSIKIEGQISGEGDLHVEGEVSGSISIPEASVTIGANGVAQADIEAKQVTIQGRVKGKIVGKERVEIAQSGSVEGDVSTGRIAVADGAVFRGSIDITR